MTNLPPHAERADDFRKGIVLGCIILGAALLFYLFTFRSGHRAGDFAMYVQHTANLAEGRPYAETGYFQNPAATSVGTKNYPPGLPILLLPIYLVDGFNVTAMKVLMTLFFFGALFVFWRLTRDRIGVGFSLAMLFDIAFTPYLWEFKDHVESDFPFLLPLFLSLWLAQWTMVRGRAVRQWLLLGVVMYAAVAIRSIGLALPITLLLFDLVDGKRVVPSARFWVPTATLIVLMVLQGVLLPLESGSYSSAFMQQVGSPLDLIDSMIRNVKFYILACAGRLLLTNGHGTLWADILLVASVGPFLLGLYSLLRSRIGILEVFFVVYAGILVVWPFRQPNYLIPAIPLLSYYTFVGLERIARRVMPAHANVAAVAAVVVLAVTFAMNYATMNFRQVPYDVMSRDSMAFYEYVKTSTPPDAVILSRVPREVAFFTGRRSTPPNLPGDHRDTYTDDEVAQLIEYMEEADVDYVAAGPKGEQFHREVLPLWQLTEEASPMFSPEYQNEEWRLYSVSLPPSSR